MNIFKNIYYTLTIKGYSKIKKSKLTPQEQIEVIQKVIKVLNSNCNQGLCNLFYCELNKNSFSSIRVGSRIPIFNVSNAVKYTNGVRDSYWWSAYPYNSTDRLKFCEWMIKVIQTVNN